MLTFGMSLSNSINSHQRKINYPNLLLHLNNTIINKFYDMLIDKNLLSFFFVIIEFNGVLGVYSLIHIKCKNYL